MWVAQGETYNLTTFQRQQAAFGCTATFTWPIFNMKFQPDSIQVQSISAYGPGWISVRDERISTSVVICSKGERFDWHCTRFEDLTPQHFEQLAALGVEVVIFGSGDRIRFPQAQWLKPLMTRQIGIETMDVQAACRTYNILAGEGRHVAVALLMEP